MATQSKVVIYNPTTMRHEPLAVGDTLDPSILPTSSGGSARKLWIGKADYKVTQIAQGSSLVIGETYFVCKLDPTDDFSNVGQGVDESLGFVATGTTPTRWKSSIVYRLDSDVVVTEYHNTIGFTITPSLRLFPCSVEVVFTSSAAYWQNPVAIYNTASVTPLSPTQARISKASTKLVLEFI